MGYDVTIGIPVYKSADVIRRTMESALAQTYPSIEFMVVDDAGHDGSIDIVKDFQKTHPRGHDIRIITHEKNLGVSSSRNQLIDEAKGEFLYFLDSDDVITPNAIELLMQNIRQYDAEIAFGSYEKIEISSQREVYQYPSCQLLGDDKLACFAYRKYAGIQASACNYLVKVDLLRQHHLYFINKDYWEDYVFTFDLVTLIKRAVLIPDITYTYICREGSLSRYQGRDVITKDEIMKNVEAVDYLKQTSSILSNKEYFPLRCYNIMMTDFYISCYIIKRRKHITPSVFDTELKKMMSHPAHFSQIYAFRHCRLPNLLFYMLGKIPAPLCVCIIRMIGKMKKLI